MALAIWDITTITSPTTLYGSTVRWVTIPDAYPAIGYMMTTTPTYATSQYGLYFEYIESTSPNSDFSGGGGLSTAAWPLVKISGRKVRSYQKGTRSFVLDGQLVTAQAGLAAIENYTRCVKRFILYYRSMNEYGETPA